MSEHADRIEKALNSGNRFRRSDVSDLLAEVVSLRAAMGKLAEHPTQPAMATLAGLPEVKEATYVSCNGYPMCHHCWASKQLTYISGGSV